MKLENFALSTKNFPIFSYQFAAESGRRPVLILGGVHGNEPEGVIAVESLLGDLIKQNKYTFSLYLVPCFNPDGFFSSNRCNGNGVDLNRNLPTKDWSPEAFSPKYPPGTASNSEPENQALVRWLDKSRPGLIISVHSFDKYMMNINGNCRVYAEAMQKINSYPIEESIGYPTPGCLGTYAGLERDMPTITYEIQRGLGLTEIIQTHMPAIRAALDTYEGENHGKN